MEQMQGGQYHFHPTRKKYDHWTSPSIQTSIGLQLFETELPFIHSEMDERELFHKILKG